VKRGDRGTLALGAGVTVRTLWNWQHRGASSRRPGRPGYAAEERRRARRLLARALRVVGTTAGLGTVAPALEEPVRTRLLRRLLAATKARLRRRHLARIASRRVHVDVRARDALWSIDATHVGGGDEAVVVREVATTRTADIGVGAAPEAKDLVRALERARLERGCLPLVLALDNGGPMRSAELRSWARREKVILLFSLPRTPQHNAWSERGMRELKEEAGIPTRTSRARAAAGPPREGDVAERLERARRALDRRPRASRGFRTAIAIDAELAPWYRALARERFHEAACSAIRDALAVPGTARARRRAVREAILATMERFGQIRRTRGGVPLLAVEPEKIS
jgi:transposase InsO family protein